MVVAQNQKSLSKETTENGAESESTMAKKPLDTASTSPMTTTSTIGSESDTSENMKNASATNSLVMVAFLVIIAISYFTKPDNLVPSGRPTLMHVWYYGWLSAISTGLGVLPLIFSPNLNTFYIGVSNAIAAGMMIAASYSLIMEGCTFNEPDDTVEMSSIARTTLGTLSGVLFIVGTKSFLDQYEDLKVGSIAGADARKILLIIFVMFLHSFAEGVGIGVSFGGINGSELGVFISTSLAMHNVPEGLAVAIVLLPRGVSKLTASLWCIATSLPQPLMAVPAFLFVHYFIPVLPIGLGFAGGAMAWVALFELLVEAYEDTNAITTGIISSISMAVMLGLQEYVDDEARGS
mmetsp:Transcript_1897/g.2730  ORF Transcript_1897/g.2730 Transcript_1897/m.2730 type:complete len:350 (+) Transcript_1897:387-1436(+)|eukprot:CAMPEP_0184863768 /NCGR_PEP_ID=MMETSP0580-20130426/12377_1 /TAXON_ID=1118495 /ORGANISM="Dactyliosolen fragilissimus" /LENGTH=349 /DNA_ID=CAMNT_0027362281 /DNA_START=279 /DNA_END=1328 /DNA_ORIENTATION=+